MKRSTRDRIKKNVLITETGREREKEERRLVKERYDCWSRNIKI